MEEIYSPTVWILPDDYLSYDRFVRVCYSLDFQSSPGIPYVYTYPTIGEWLHRDGLVLGDNRLQLLWLDVQDLINKKFDVVLRVFIKREPHKKKKILSKRWRLIMASPLCVQVLWSMLFSFQNDLEIDHVTEIPSKQGMSLVHGHWKFYYKYWKTHRFNFCVDAEAWDWTMPYWKLMWDLDFRFRMGRGRKIEEWFELGKYLYELMFKDPIVALSDGNCYKQVIPGIMKSGCKNTISTNSHAQLIDHVIVCIRTNKPIYPPPDVCGDDKFQNEVNAADPEELAKLGVKVKISFRGSEFIGHEMSPNGPVPLYFKKHLFNYCLESPEFLNEFLESMLVLYAHSEKFSFWYNLALFHNARIKSKHYYLNLYDSIES